ncbi:MAG TPA: hypothetical protein VK859_11520 [bacterium]|jgi:hypothetical protein|nr:hypothetical protein [bacterium]
MAKISKNLGLIFIGFFGVASWAYADYGCHFTMGSRLSTPLNREDIKISFRFTCQQAMDLIAVSFYCEQAQKPPAYKISLQEDQDGLPLPQALETSTVTPKGGCWITVPINNLSLLSGKVYHLVIEQDSMRGGQHKVGIIDGKHFASVAYGDDLNPFDPRAETPDAKLNVLVSEKGKWKILNRQPLFALHGSGSKLQGVPYEDFGDLPIHGNGTPGDRSDDMIQGEALHPHYGLTATGFAIRVRKIGAPTAPLNYRVYTINFMQHKTDLAFSGEALLPSQAPVSYQWVTIGIKAKDNPKSFPPECRYIVFQTDSGRGTDQSPGCEDCYSLSEVGNSGGLAGAADMSFDGGAHLSREVTSSDGWKTWQDAFERDANVVILGPVSANSTLPTPGLIPTPAPVMMDIAP